LAAEFGGQSIETRSGNSERKLQQIACTGILNQSQQAYPLEIEIIAE
jgi:hypothetical protein